MLRTLGVFVAGMLLGFIVMAGLIWAGIGLPQQFGPFALYLIEALTGGAVGLFVGSLQKKQAGFLALSSLLPMTFRQYVNPFSRPATGLRLFELLLGTLVELSIAFLIAHYLSRGKTRLLKQ